MSVKEVVAVPPTPAPKPIAPSAARPTGRRVRLTASRIDPWSAMKVSFLVAVGLGIATVIMITVLWMLLSGMGVFDQINSMVNKVIGDTSTKFDLMDIAGFGRVVGFPVRGPDRRFQRDEAGRAVWPEHVEVLEQLV